MKKIIIFAIIFSLTGCATPEDRQKWALVGAALAVGAVAYQAGKHGGFASPQQKDYDWDWDEFYNANFGRMVWVCRGVQTAQFADEWRCSSKAKIDWRWPQK